MTWKRIATRSLLAFALITIGFALGKEAGLRAARPSPEPGRPAAAPQQVVVTYFHATFRCVTCNTIEKLAKETVESTFADALNNNQLVWKTANYQEREDLARAYALSAAAVVVSVQRDGKTITFDRLDKVWDLVNDPPAFSDYIADAVQKRLNGQGDA